MIDEKHKRTCEREMSKFRRNTKFSRTQSFTYGAQPEGHDSSPSAGIASRRPTCGEQGGLNTISSRQRRMASY
jgi:M-phase inducer tyrosine phosphatase